ncbi:Uncharacterised protein [Candidatus Gugararchaeum adminiculabundum]|nr:Uncharacterised protein [Candidatus Gugararchaeum adminiculabundum]
MATAFKSISSKTVSLGPKIRSKRAAKVGRTLRKSPEFAPTEVDSVEKSIDRSDTRDEVFARALVSILDSYGISPRETAFLKKSFAAALANTEKNRNPLSEEDLERIKEIFSRLGVSEKAKHKFAYEVSIRGNDQVLSHMNNFLNALSFKQQKPFGSGQLASIPKKRK